MVYMDVPRNETKTKPKIDYRRFACGRQYREHTSKIKPNRVNMRMTQPKFYDDIEFAYVETGVDSKVYRAHHKDIHITVYPLTLWCISAKGWGYELYSEKRNIDWNSLFETANTGVLTDDFGDHARTSDQAMKWAIRTVNEWDN